MRVDLHYLARCRGRRVRLTALLRTPPPRFDHGGGGRSGGGGGGFVAARRCAPRRRRPGGGTATGPGRSRVPAGESSSSPVPCRNCTCRLSPAAEILHSKERDSACAGRSVVHAAGRSLASLRARARFSGSDGCTATVVRSDHRAERIFQHVVGGAWDRATGSQPMVPMFRDMV